MKEIRIPSTADADTRTANGKVSKERLLDNSRQHISDVNQALHFFVGILLQKGVEHDWTKIDNIDEFYADFASTQDGFQGDFKQMHWYHDIHLQERHHLKEYCPEDVNLLDVLERIADGVMAGMGRAGFIYEDELNPEILTKAYNNTMKLLANNTEVIQTRQKPNQLSPEEEKK